MWPQVHVDYSLSSWAIFGNKGLKFRLPILSLDKTNIQVNKKQSYTFQIELTLFEIM